MMEKDELILILKRIETEVHTIKRGVYGDKDNDVKGLIQTDREQEMRIKSLEDTKKQAIWFGGGALIIIELVWQFIKGKLDL